MELSPKERFQECNFLYETCDFGEGLLISIPSNKPLLFCNKFLPRSWLLITLWLKKKYNHHIVVYSGLSLWRFYELASCWGGLNLVGFVFNYPTITIVLQNHIVWFEMGEKMSGDFISLGLICGLIFVIAVISFLTLGED